MKVLLLNQVFYPDSVATAQHGTDLALYLIERGCEVTVVAGNRGYEDRKRVFPSYELYREIHIHRVASTGFGKKSFFHRLVDAVTFDLCLIWKLIRLPRHDLVIAFTSPPLIGLFGAFFCAIKGGRLVQWLMDLNPDTAIAVGYLKKHSFAARMLNHLFRLTLERSDQLVVLDRWMKERVVAHGANPEQVVIVPPWPVQEARAPKEPTVTQKETVKNPLREKYGIENKFVVLYSGNHSIVHPLDTLLETALKSRHDDSLRFVFIGGGLRVAEVTAFAQKHALTNIVQIPFQPREMLVHSLGMADAHIVVMGAAVNGMVHTSKIYGVLATGKPYICITPSQSHLVDLIQECPGGLHVGHGRSDLLAEAIQQIRRMTPEEIKAQGEKNIRYATTRFSRDVTLGHFAQEVLNGTRSETAATRLVGT